MKIFIKLLLVTVLVQVCPIKAMAMITDNAENITESSDLKVTLIDTSANTIEADSPNKISYKFSIKNDSNVFIKTVSTSVQRKNALTNVKEYTDIPLLAPEQYNDFYTAPINKNLQLPPKTSKEFTINLGINGNNNETDGDLSINKNGVYPLLFNIQATDNSDHNIYVGKKVLLPINNLPQSKNPQTLRPSEAIPTTLIWPIAGERNLISAPTGMSISPYVISNKLSEAFAPTGWLTTMLNSLEQHLINPHNNLNKSICLAIDPSTVILARYMSGDYRVLENSVDPLGKTLPGTYSNDAKNWLNTLKKLVKNTCVITLPLGAPNLNFLAKLDDSLLNKRALVDSKTVVDDILEINSTNGLTISPSGLIDEHTLFYANKNKIKNLLVSDDTFKLNSPAYKTKDSTIDTNTSTKLTVYDGVLSDAFNEIGNDENPKNIAAVENSIGLLQLKTTKTTQIIYPGTEWKPNGKNSDSILNQFEKLFNKSLITPAPLTSATASPTPSKQTAGIFSGNFSAENLSKLSSLELKKNTELLVQINQLYSAMVSVPNTSFNKESIITPLLDNILRGLSTLFNGPNTTFNFMTEHYLKQIRESVTLVSPAQKYTLASEKSPIPLAINNKLPIRIKVDILTNPPKGVTIDSLKSIIVPSNSTLQVNVPAHTDVKKFFSIDFKLQTTSGLSLGNPVKVNIKSNAYGNILLDISIIILIIFAVLSGRRLWRRFRNKNTAKDIIRINVKDIPDDQ